MCGIAGLIAKKRIGEERFSAFEEASKLMLHRGPDFHGVWRKDNIILIHHRLSILDLDVRSNQPFLSANGNYITVFNGEIYNFKELADKHKIVQRTTSDTEVMIETFVSKGPDAIVEWNGIFASAIFDEKSNELHLIRDRFGVKPLYIFENEEVILFASEAKVILNWLHSFTIDSVGLSQYLWYGHTTGELTMVQGLKKLDPGTHLRIDTLKGHKIEIKKFWSLKHVSALKITESQAISQTRTLLEAAVKRQLIADVPVGVFLSGGIDSSSIVAFASKHYGMKLDTYSIDYDYNIGGESELKKASMIASRFGTNHHELRVESNDVKNIFGELVFQYDEPFADPGSIPLYQLARSCSADKRVVLQGDGGDELFAGYRRYNVLDNFLFWRLASFSYPFIPKRRWKERMKRLHFVLGQHNRGMQMAYYLTEDVPYKNPFQIIHPGYISNINDVDWYRDYMRIESDFKNLDRVQQLLYADATILLPNSYLEKVDKATMLCSLEARVPFLDNELAEFALSLPANLKVRRGEKKYLLKKALSGIIPDSILYGPKRGFDVPIRTWLREDLYDFAKDSFNTNTSQILNTAGLEEILDTHKRKEADYSSLLYKGLVLSHWLNIYKDKISI